MDKKEYLRSWAETYKNDLTNNDDGLSSVPLHTTM